jgi:D-3-phosphoglycerate dehydrogenase
MNAIKPNIWLPTDRREAIVFEGADNRIITDLAQVYDGVTDRRNERFTTETKAEILANPDLRVMNTRNGTQQNVHELLDAGKNLEAVFTRTVGTENLPLVELANRGIMVMNCSVESGRSVAELVLKQILDLLRKTNLQQKGTENQVWEKSHESRYEIQGKKVGIVGLGKIGSLVAEIMTSLGAEVIFYDTQPQVREANKHKYHAASSLEELFRKSQIITVNASPTDPANNFTSNNHLITPELLDQFAQEVDPEKKGPRILVNAAREIFLEPEEIISAYTRGIITGIGLDVFPQEGKKPQDSFENPFAELIKRGENIVTSHHEGASTEEAQDRVQTGIIRKQTEFFTYGTIADSPFTYGRTYDFNGTPNDQLRIVVMHGTEKGTSFGILSRLHDQGLNISNSHQKDFRVAHKGYFTTLGITQIATDTKLSPVEFTKLRELLAGAPNVRSGWIIDPVAMLKKREIAEKLGR